MKRILVLLCGMALIFGAVAAANATTIRFDFEDLVAGDGETEVSSYMTNILNSYGIGSSVIAIATQVENGAAPLGPDNYVQNMATLGEHAFGFYFEHPLLSVSFDWGVVSDPFIFTADGNTILAEDYDLWEAGTSGEILFSDYGLGPVSLLGFHDGGAGKIMIDNLAVNPAPEPATLLLMGSGLLGAAGICRKRFKRL